MRWCVHGKKRASSLEHGVDKEGRKRIRSGTEHSSWEVRTKAIKFQQPLVLVSFLAVI